MPRTGIDLGGTKIEIVVLAPSGDVLFEKRVATPAPDYHATVTLLNDLLGEAESVTQTKTSVGIGTPGSLSPKTGLLRNSNSVWMNGKPLAADINAAMAREVRIANDANCFALSEATDGAGQGARAVFGVIIGTGCGGGVVVDGHIVNGANGIGGEWGHNPLPWPDETEFPAPECWCGRFGCQEVWFSGSGLRRDHLTITGDDLRGEEIVARAARADTACQATLARHANRLARGLACVCNLLDPEVIVLGGGLSNMPHIYADLPGLMEPFVFSDHVSTQIVAPVHGDASGVRGAAWLW
ncbi:MAG: ROK family protein [Rhizobiales bacterium]|nr:ROK family protein [Hyphomicrobiales bacterium]